MTTIDPQLPLIDLHRHLDGSVRISTVIDLAQQHGIELPAYDEEGMRPYVQVTEPQPDLMTFISKFEWLTAVMVDADACRRIAYENVLDASQEGIDYVELRFSPLFMGETHKLDAASVVEAVVDGVRTGEQDAGIRANLIGILSRTYGPDVAQKELEAILVQRDQISALDLAGDESNYPGELFVEHFAHARNLGMEITVHAGEAAGPESVWQAIDELGAMRLGHARYAIEDPTLVETLAQRKIGVEVSLTSNVQTSTVPSYSEHPLRSYLEAGVLATINTDDPSISGIDLTYEYEVAAPQAGLSQDQICQAQKNALAIAFLSENEKQQLLNGASET